MGSDDTDDDDQPTIRVPIQVAFDGLLSAIDAKAEASDVTLSAGASEDAVQFAEQALGVTFPAEVRAFFLRHDGGPDGAIVVGGTSLLSLAKIVDRWGTWTEKLSVPIGADAAGAHHVVDLSPGEGGRRGQIRRIAADGGSTVVAPSLLAWLGGATWGK
ncbi:MAG: SMI1/KNR4 family protein [Myxococcota bacterium]